MNKKTQNIDYKAIVWKEEKHFVAQCLNVDVSSFGASKREALESLKEALELYFEDNSAVDMPKIEGAEIVSASLAHA